MADKKFYASKTLWTNAAGAAAIAANASTGNQVSGDEIAAGLVILNLLLRLFTKGKVTL